MLGISAAFFADLLFNIFAAVSCFLKIFLIPSCVCLVARGADTRFLGIYSKICDQASQVASRVTAGYLATVSSI